MSSFADEFKEEARSAQGRAVFRDIQGWRFGLSFGNTTDITREEYEHVKSGQGSQYANKYARPTAITMTYEQYIERNRREKEEQAAKGITDRTWCLSASLWPRGRGSTERDWRYLGEMLAAIGAPIESCQTPIETTHPNDVHYWIWEERPDGQEDNERADRRD